MLKKCDPKGQYAQVKSDELKNFKCIDDTYEPSLKPEVVSCIHELTIEESAHILFHRLYTDGILEGAPKLTPPVLPNSDGDEFVDIHTSEEAKE